MKERIFWALFTFFLFVLTGCQEDAQSGLGATNTYSDISNIQTTDSEASEENDDDNGSYMAQMNLVERMISDSGSYDYVPFRDGIIYDGGKLEFYIEYTFSGKRKNVKSMDTVVLLFVDGYIQECSVESDETALLHNITIQNNETERLCFSCTPTT